LVAGLCINGHARVAFVSVAAAGFLVAVVFRRKAPHMPGALWSSSADLMRDGSRFPGELSLLADAVVWMPSAYSRQHGFNRPVRVALETWGGLEADAGSGLLDVVISVRSADGQTLRFATHRSPGLVEVICRLRATNPYQ
jgi:hypothetical protein